MHWFQVLRCKPGRVQSLTPSGSGKRTRWGNPVKVYTCPRALSKLGEMRTYVDLFTMLEIVILSLHLVGETFYAFTAA